MQRKLQPPKGTVNQQVVTIDGRFRPNGSSAIDNTENVGLQGCSVAYSTTGIYVITLDDKYNYVYSVNPSCELATAADTQIQWTSSGTGTDTRGNSVTTITVTALTAGSAADIASNAGNWIAVSIRCSRGVLGSTGRTP